MVENSTLYNTIGGGYNTSRKADPFITERIYSLLAITKGNCIDVGCGTGNYTIALNYKGISFCGLEPVEEMLNTARSRSSDITWLQGSAENIPAENELFDGAIATLTIHHWNNLEIAFHELYRVLKAGAGLVIFTASPHQMSGYWLNHYFPAMMQKSISQMPPAETIIEALTTVGFIVEATEKYFIEPDLQDNFLYAGKHDPERYFKAEIRKGISSFAALSNKHEVDAGLAVLRTDIDNGNFEKIKGSYGNDEGEYLFIKAIKPL